MKIIKYVLFTLTVIISLNSAHFVVSAQRVVPAPKKIERMKGEVKWFNAQKGYGFITPENGEDLYVHYLSILGGRSKTLTDGQKVTYQVEVIGLKGRQAVEVQPL